MQAHHASTLIRLAGATLAAAVLVSAPLSAQYLKHRDPKIPRLADGSPNLNAPAPRLADGTPDLGGLWNATDGRFLTNIASRAGFEAPFTPWGAALFAERQENQGRDRPAGQCLPHTIPNAMMVPNYPWKLVQTPGLTVILFENFTQFRQIFADGRDHPVERSPAWFGYSTGTWDGDTFVVDTVGFNDKSWLDDGGHPRSDQMRTTERFRRVDFGHLEVEVTFTDPVAYTRPWTVTLPFQLLADTDIIENICENEKDMEHIFFGGLTPK
jgi:hypothetical protein